MGGISSWLAATGTVLVLLGYELSLLAAERREPGRLARTTHANLREDWFEAISHLPGTEVLAVQTLRNSLMSATMTASAAALALMGTVTLAAPSLHGTSEFGARLAMELVLIALLFASLVCSVMAARYYNHAGFVGGMPVQSQARKRWNAAGIAYVRRAGLLYSWSLRHLVLVAPVVAFVLHDAAGPVAALLVVFVLNRFDRLPANGWGNEPTEA